MVMAVDRVSETVALTTRPSYQHTSVYSLFEVCKHRRHKQEVQLRPVLAPVKYSDTAYVFINNTRKRFVSRTYYEPRLRPRSFAETTYADPETTEKRYVTFVDSCPDQVKSWFRTSVEIKPRKFKSSMSYPDNSFVSSNKTSSSSLPGGASHPGSVPPSNGYSEMEDVDENMNRRIPTFREKYDPGASQVFIPKRKDHSPDDVLLDQISGQILIDYPHNNLCNGYADFNGHRSDVSDL